MTSEEKLECALSASIDCLRLAEKILSETGYEKTAFYIRERAEKNAQLLSPLVRR